MTTALSVLCLVLGGLELSRLGGSAYYLLAGIAVVAIGLLLFRRNRWALPLCGLFFLATIL